MMTFPPYPITVHTPLGDGWVVYITANGMHENDEVTVALEADGQWRHFSSSQVQSFKNETYGVAATKDAELEKEVEFLKGQLDSIARKHSKDIGLLAIEVQQLRELIYAQNPRQ